jgi:DNA-binding response OmpR family regulator
MSGLKPRVLVLDEDVLALELYTRELKENYQVVACRNVDESRKLLKNETFDMFIIEPAVNDGEGWTILKEVQSIPMPPLVILCSVEDERKCGLEQGAHAFIVKPVSMPVLHSLLDHMASQNAARNLPKRMLKAEKGK